jgi:hypothetical protein
MYQVATVLSLCLTMTPTLLMRKVACIPFGPHGTYQGRVVCCDSDHDSLPELIFSTGNIQHSWDPTRIEVWEHEGWNRFKLVHADTGDTYLWHQYPTSIKFGNAAPVAAGDVDGDGLTDLLCITCHTLRDTLLLDVITVESPSTFSYPCSLTWHYPYMRNQAPQVTPAFYLPNIGGDGPKRILVTGTWIWKNMGNDSNELVWCNHERGFGAFGDFAGNGRLELAGGVPVVWECIGDDKYVQVYIDTTDFPGRGGGMDMFTTDDIDRNGRPEFCVTYFSYPQGRVWLRMYQDESDGNHQFTPTMVDSLRFWGGSVYTQSTGGDIDGDGVDECFWTTPDSVRAYKAFGDNDLRKVWELQLDSSPFDVNSWTTTIYDMNKDGYNEWMLAGNDSISIFEVDAVDLLSPNGGSCSVGDTVPIRWVTNYPPRCDSLSLFLRRDSLWHLSTIATGLPGTDTLYRWVVPSGVPETARVVVIAYGPGWQFDISDSVITFIGGGVVEGTRNVPLQWSLSVSPNPARGAFSVRYDVPRQSRVSVGVYDAGGRLVRSLSEGEVVPGRYEAKLPSGALPAGIYFLRLDTPGFRSVKKAVVAR